MIETLVRTSGCYVGIFDCSAAIHREGSLSSVFDKAKSDAEEDRESWNALGHINEQFLERSRGGEILVWIVLFDGCFKVQIKVLSPEEEFGRPETQPAVFLGGEVHDLSCPTGSIVVASLHNLGNPNLRPTVEAEPGIYEVSLIRDEQQEAKHEFLDHELTYPAGDGPDWYLILKRMAGTKS